MPELPAESDRFLELLMDYGERQAAPTILYYGDPEGLLFVSRNREMLRKHFRFVIARADLVEDIVDKVRFSALAEKFDLPVPSSVSITTAFDKDPEGIGIPFPLLMKPVTRRSAFWLPGLDNRKAIEVENTRQLSELLRRAGEAAVDVTLQEYIPGPESRVESYHAYVDESGEVVGEFMGRKIRTWPRQYGHSTALETTDALDVRDLGRSIMSRLNLTGVAKLDFKRAPDGRLYLLEINPRFNLWHFLGAEAGVHLPHLVWADLNGLPRPPTAVAARAGKVWCHPLDFYAARQEGIRLHQWLKFFCTASIRSSISIRDPKLTAVYLAKSAFKTRTFFDTDAGPDN